MAIARVRLPNGESLEIDDQRLTPYRVALAADERREDQHAYAEYSEGMPRGSRLAFAAAHVVMKGGYSNVPHSPSSPGAPGEIFDWIDWAATDAIRQHLVACGFGIAEAMDTAQRFSIGWPAAKELIRRCGALKPPRGFVAGAGYDQRPEIADVASIVDAVCEQVAVIRDAGGIPIILPLGKLVEWNCGPDDYVETYRAIVRNSRGPLLVHWLGEMFAPHLKGYFPADSFERVMDIDPARIRGAKLSLLDADLELRLRRRLVDSEQIILTGDDMNFASLIAGTETAPPSHWTKIGESAAALGDFSHALLGIFDGIAEPAGLALRFLDIGRRDEYHALMEPCERLSRVVFEPPTPFYKTGLALLSWLAGRQDNCMLVNHEEQMRSTEHGVRVVHSAAECGVFPDAALAASRFERWLIEAKQD